MAIFKNIFTWWEGATFGTWLGTKLGGVTVGQDEAGNRYFEAARSVNGLKRRWVIYAGSNDASRIPPEWHSWIHHQIEGLPDTSLPAPRVWEAPAAANMTGTDAAYRPAGAGPNRALATGDYQAWSPEGA